MCLIFEHMRISPMKCKLPPKKYLYLYKWISPRESLKTFICCGGSHYGYPIYKHTPKNVRKKKKNQPTSPWRGEQSANAKPQRRLGAVTTQRWVVDLRKSVISKRILNWFRCFCYHPPPQKNVPCFGHENLDVAGFDGRYGRFDCFFGSWFHRKVDENG